MSNISNRLSKLENAYAAAGPANIVRAQLARDREIYQATSGIRDAGTRRARILELHLGQPLSIDWRDWLSSDDNVALFRRELVAKLQETQ